MVTMDSFLGATRGAPSDLTLIRHEAATDIASAPALDCECMLCDLPLHQAHQPVQWRLVWDFNRAPAVVFDQASMLLCVHCLHHWLDDPDAHGGDPVRYHPV
jgi:hypothetical protein